jgi:SAM-dependent methyltransferase
MPENIQSDIRPWDFDLVFKYGDFKKFDNVLEVGALLSYFSIKLSPLVNSIRVTDSFAWGNRRYMGHDGIDSAVEWADKIKRGGNNLVVETADAQNLPYFNESFEKVVCISVIEHVENDSKAMSEMMRVLKPGGRLLLTTEYNPLKSERVDDPDGAFYRIYDDAGIDRLIDGYNVIYKDIQKEHLTEYTTIFIALSK